MTTVWKVMTKMMTTLPLLWPDLLDIKMEKLFVLCLTVQLQIPLKVSQ